MVKMVDAKGSGDASPPISSPKNDNEMSALAETIASSPTKANLDEFVVVSESENKVKEVRNEENPMEKEHNGEHAIKEKEEKNGQDAMEVEEEDKNEQDAKEEEHNGEHGIKAKETNGQDAMEEEEGKNEEDAVEGQQGAGNDKSNEKNKKKVSANSNEKVKNPRKRIRGKKVLKGTANKMARKDEDKPKSSGKKSAEEKVESTIASKDEDKPESSGKKDAAKITESTGLASKDEDKPASSRKKSASKKVESKAVASNEDKPESSGKEKAAKKVESMGMIFMCSSKTKKDCYRYKVLGLPANKKDIVQKVYKGMRLFLFDFDLRLMYGIYKAAGPGGSNIEPKAFKSAFPSQVRFTVLEDCLPLAEEKFKKVIKDNYYSRNKFDCQLNSEQVKKLCKLFVPASEGSKPQEISRSLVPERHAYENHGRIRKRARDEERGSALGRERRHHERPVIYAREGVRSQRAPLARGQRMPAAAPAPLYVYGRTLEMDSYRREPVLEHRGFRVVDLEPRHQDETESRDPYLSYREREAPSYGETVYSAGLRPEYYRPAALPAEHRPVGREADYRNAIDLPTEYRSPAGLPAEYRSSVGLLARYRPAGVTAEQHAQAGLPHEYHSLSALRDYDSTLTMYRY